MSANPRKLSLESYELLAHPKRIVNRRVSAMREEFDSRFGCTLELGAKNYSYGVSPCEYYSSKQVYAINSLEGLLNGE